VCRVLLFLSLACKLEHEFARTLTACISYRQVQTQKEQLTVQATLAKFFTF
jgi:hypothetical protein